MGKLFLVGTPIGNLEDITLRAIRVLKEVNLVAAEDTRHTGKLLQYLQIQTPQVSYHEHNYQSRTPEIISRWHRGESVALVTDAGMPCISDPGIRLVQAAIANGVEVMPIPGGTAMVSALAASGLPTARFVFEGFLPVKYSERQARLDELKTEVRTMIFYEAPHRLNKTLEDLAQSLGDCRELVLARELTKVHEEFWRGTIAEAIAMYSLNKQPKGEYTLVVRGEQVQKLISSTAEIKQELQQLLAQGLTRSQASRQLAKLSNFSRREIYQLELE